MLDFVENNKQNLLVCVILVHYLGKVTSEIDWNIGTYNRNTILYLYPSTVCVPTYFMYLYPVFIFSDRYQLLILDN